MKKNEIVNAVRENGRQMKLIFVGGYTELPTVGLSDGCDEGRLMTLNLKVFMRSLRIGEMFVIGRDANANYHLPDDTRFSRIHCVIDCRDGECYVYDCSLNGTVVCE